MPGGATLDIEAVFGRVFVPSNPNSGRSWLIASSRGKRLNYLPNWLKSRAHHKAGNDYPAKSVTLFGLVTKANVRGAEVGSAWSSITLFQYRGEAAAPNGTSNCCARSATAPSRHQSCEPFASTESLDALVPCKDRKSTR